MSTRPTIEELLLRAAAGEVDPRSDEFRAALGGDPRAQEAAEEWLATAAGLDALAHEEERDRAEAEPQEEDLALARSFAKSATLQRGSPAPPAASGRRPGAARRLGLWGALALGTLAAAAWLAWTLLGRVPAPAREPLILGAHRFELLAPRARVEAYGEFRWSTVELPPLARYRLVVEGCGRELLRVDGLLQPVYAPPAGESARLADCDAITWSVAVLSGDGADSILAWGSAEASRR